MKSNKWLYIQSCLDCGFIPNKKSVEAFEKKKEWSITELDVYRKKYQEEHK